MFQKGSPREAGQTAILILVGILVLVGVVSGVYFLGKSNKNEPVKVVSQPQITAQPTPQPTSVPQASASGDMADWKTYTNSQYKFSLSYPPDWEAQVPEVSNDNFRLDFLKFDKDYNEYDRPNIALIVNEENNSDLQAKLNTEYTSQEESTTIGSFTGYFYQGINEVKDFSGKNTFKRYKADFLINKSNLNFWFRLATKPELGYSHIKVFKQMISTFRFIQ